ncbi:hypothetical protein HK100_004239, partial [Physocladia obscura]
MFRRAIRQTIISTATKTATIAGVHSTIEFHSDSGRFIRKLARHPFSILGCKSLFSTWPALANTAHQPKAKNIADIRKTQQNSMSKPKKKGVRAVGVATQRIDELNANVSQRSPPTHRATAFSIAESFNFLSLLPILQQNYILLPFIADDVYHIKIKSDDDLYSVTSTHSAEVFLFSNGVFVTWGATDEQIDDLLKLANDVGQGTIYRDSEIEWFDYIVDSEHKGGIVNDTIVIGSDIPADQYKLAFSSGLARSAKLASLENLLDAHLHKNRNIPNLLLRGKKLPLGRHTILKSLGELFSLRGH